MKLFVSGAAFAALLGLSACVTQPLVPYDRSISADNKTIGLLSPGWPTGPSAVLASDMGQSFGLVGALVDATMQSNRERDLSHILDEQKVDANRIFIAGLTDMLKDEGYSVISVAAQRKGADFVKTYPAASANPVDSYLDISVLNYGYVAAGMGDSSPYRPWVMARVKLVRASDDKVLMEDMVAYNTITVIKNVITISPDPTYAFPSWSNLTADPKRAADGVSTSVHQSAESIGKLLK
jgi:hypothetical protein